MMRVKKMSNFKVTWVSDRNRHPESYDGGPAFFDDEEGRHYK